MIDRIEKEMTVLIKESIARLMTQKINLTYEDIINLVHSLFHHIHQVQVTLKGMRIVIAIVMILNQILPSLLDLNDKI